MCNLMFILKVCLPAYAPLTLLCVYPIGVTKCKHFCIMRGIRMYEHNKTGAKCGCNIQKYASESGCIYAYTAI